jgi:ferredoxin
MGVAFRKKSIKSENAWRFRHLKWVLTGFYFVLFVIVLFPFSNASFIVDSFFGLVGVVYFGSFLVIPLTGNRNWCRWLCPYGGTFGILNKVGFYKIRADKEKCISCGQCTKECDMGITVQHLVETKGEVNLADCVGCGRCITNCPKKVLRFTDVRSLFKKIPSSVENDLTADVIHQSKEIKTAESMAIKLKDHEPWTLRPFKDAKSNDYIAEYQRNSMLSNSNSEDDYETRGKNARVTGEISDTV